MRELEFTTRSRKHYEKLTKADPRLVVAIAKTLDLLRRDPKDRRLSTHKVHISEFGKVYSSRVTGDLRIIWNYAKEVLLIYVLEIGGHSGRYKVYK